MSESHLPTWMPSLPPDWATASIDQLAVRVGSGVTPTGGSEVYTESGVTFIRSQNVTNRGLSLEDAAFIDHKTHAQMSASEVYPFDVLLNITGASIGRCYFLPEGLGPANVNQHVCAIRFPKPDFHDAKFLASILASPIGLSQIVRLNAGGNREGLNYQQLRSFRVPWPPKKVRSAVAEILTTVDEAMEQTEALVGKLEQMKAGLMHDLFTRGVTPDGHLRPTRQEAPHHYHQNPRGWLPKEWEVKPLGHLSEIVSGITLGSKLTIPDGVKVPYLRVANVQDGYLDLSDVKHITVTPAQLEKLALKSGDVLMNEGGDFDKLGRGSVWQEEITPCVHQNHVFRVRPKAGILRSYFLAFWSQSEAGKRYFILNSKQSTNLASINSTQLHKFPVALPKLSEQEQIEGRIAALKGKIDIETTHLAKLRQQKQGLMQDLLTGRVRVNAPEPS